MVRRYDVAKREKVASKKLCNEFSYADDVYLTKTKIAVRKVRSDSNGHICSVTTKYFPKTRKNLSCACKILGPIRTGRN